MGSVPAAAVMSALMAAAAERFGERVRLWNSGVTALMVCGGTLDLKLERRLLAEGLSMARLGSAAVVLAGSVAAGFADCWVADGDRPLTLIDGPLMPSLVDAHSGPASGWFCVSRTGTPVGGFDGKGAKGGVGGGSRAWRSEAAEMGGFACGGGG